SRHCTEIDRFFASLLIFVAKLKNVVKTKSASKRLDRVLKMEFG
ncbi:MAG: hypothetical protein ACI9ZD_002910, partial [Paracoccaceae bacterium]